MIWLHFIFIMVVWRKTKKIEEMVVQNGNENEKTSKREKKWKEKKNKKLNDPRDGELRREWDP